MKIILNQEFFKQDRHTSFSARMKKVKAKRRTSTKVTVKNDEQDYTIDKILPVMLSPDLMKDFVLNFHPKKHGPDAVYERMRFVLDIQKLLEALFEGFRAGLNALYNQNYDANSIGNTISAVLDQSWNTSVDPAVTRTYMESMRTGGHHIIRDSTRYKGGKDLLFVGQRGPNHSPLLCAGRSAVYNVPVFAESYGYEKYKTAYEHKYGAAIVETANLVQGLLYGTKHTEPSAPYSRAYEQHSFSSTAQLVKRVYDVVTKGPMAKAGLAISLPNFESLMPAVSLPKFEEYYSVLAMREPLNAVVQAKVRSTGPDESLNICPNYQALKPEIKFSIVANIPREFCEYITQTKDAQIPLVSLNTWALMWSGAMFKPPHTRSRKGDTGGGRSATPFAIPRYVMRPSVSTELTKRREELGLYVEKGRVNEDGLMISYNGDIACMVSKEDSVHAVDNAKEYEQLLEEILSISFEAGAPLTGSQGSVGAVYDLASKNYAEKIAQYKVKLDKYRGKVQAINWDLNATLTVNASSSDRIAKMGGETMLNGANTPDAHNLAVYLRGPFSKTMRDMFSHSTFGGLATQSRGQMGISSISFEGLSDAITQSSLFKNFAMVYNYFAQEKKVPGLEELISKAAEALKITSLSDEEHAPYELNPINPQQSIYKQIISPDLKLSEDDRFKSRPGHVVIALLAEVSKHASGLPGSVLARVCMKENIDISDHDRWFDGKLSQVGEFSRLYTWLGGQIFLQAAMALLAVDKKDIIRPNLDADSTDDHVRYTSFEYIMSEVLPLCVMLGKYTAPEIRDKIYEISDSQKEKGKDFGLSDLNLAGSRGPDSNGKGGMKLFPHQVEALAQLKAHPKIAVLDISPGGGKTTIGLADIAMLHADGLIKRPFVFAPNRLVKNWMEDLEKSFKGWNAIAVTTANFNLWGEDRLTEILQNAPANTIVIVSTQFLSHGKRRAGVKPMIVVGNARVDFSHAVEFCKKFSPDYVLLDESHRIRNTSSILHKGIKSINQMSSVKYGRIGTGTLIQNVMSDVVGQSAIFSGQIFRTTDEFNAVNKVLGPTGKEVYASDTPSKARLRLKEFATVISFRRRDWAFMLPIPIETFIPVEMDDDQYGDDGKKMQTLYNAVLEETLPKSERKKKKEADEDDDEQSGEEIHQTVKFGNTEIEVGDDDEEDDDEEEEEAGAQLQARLEILERLLTDPFSDPKLQEHIDRIWGSGAPKPEDFVAPKIQAVIKRIKGHFTENPWRKGAKYVAGNIVDYNGKSFIFKSDTAWGKGEEESHHAPDEDTKLWQPQVRGKIFITTRFTRSVLAIYRALPADIKSQTVMFYGDLPNRDDNIARFQSDPKVKILIANEQAVTEGHNFQAASRFIRVEAPWAPGELDQTMSRIFRPDVGGEYARQSIFIDWILCDHTLEVAKMGRLVSKMLHRAQFDEMDNPNPKYYKELNPLNLEPISMSIDNLRRLRDMRQLMIPPGSDFEPVGDKPHPHSYFGQYGYLVGQQAEEFLEMRKTRSAKMHPVEPTKMPEGAAKIEFFPWVPNLIIADENDEGLVLLRSELEGTSDLANEFRKDTKVLIGQIVRTEFGLGKIVKVTRKRVGTSVADSEVEDDEDDGVDARGTNALSKVNVELFQGGGIRNFSPSKVYLCPKLTEREAQQRNKRAPKITDADRNRTAKAAKEAEIKLKKLAERARQPRAPRAPVAAPTRTPKAKAEMSVRLYPMVINKLLAVMAEGVDEGAEEKALKRYGFKKFGDYAYLPISTYQNFTAALDYLERKYTLDPKLVAYLDTLHDSFQSGRGRKFNVELAPASEMPIFYREHTVIVKQNPNVKKKRVRVYPVIVGENLMLAVDLTTNPLFRREVGKVITGMSGKSNSFKIDLGMFVQVVRNISELRNVVKNMRAGGIEVENLEAVKKEVSGLTFKPSRN